MPTINKWWVSMIDQVKQWTLLMPARYTMALPRPEHPVPSLTSIVKVASIDRLIMIVNTLGNTPVTFDTLYRLICDTKFNTTIKELAVVMPNSKVTTSSSSSEGGTVIVRRGLCRSECDNLAKEVMCGDCLPNLQVVTLAINEPSRESLLISMLRRIANRRSIAAIYPVINGNVATICKHPKGCTRMYYPFTDTCIRGSSCAHYALCRYHQPPTIALTSCARCRAYIHLMTCVPPQPRFECCGILASQVQCTACLTIADANGKFSCPYHPS